MTQARPLLYAAASLRRAAIVDAAGALVAEGPIAEVVAATIARKATITSYQPQAHTAVLAAMLDGGRIPDVAVRAVNTAPTLMGLRLPGDGAHWQDGTAICPEPLPIVAGWLGLPVLPPLPRDDQIVDCARAWASLHGAWSRELAECAGLGRDSKLGDPVRFSLGGTAAAAAIPRSWRAASAMLAQSEVWRWLRQAYHGGRIELYRPGWQGEAVEYDLRSAYGWALTQWLPDFKTYEARRPLRHEPGWYDATVELSGEIGPLPIRVADPRRGHTRLSWPSSGRHRGVWTRIELEQPGVQVIEVHRAVAGRWSDDLRRPVLAWLEAREATTDPMRRAILRGLACSLSGKLAQTPVTWQLWLPSMGDDAPIGALPLGLDCPAFAVPVEPARWPTVAPGAVSYCTAIVRCRVAERLRLGGVIYTDTDSVHLPAGAEPPSPIGSKPGEWSIKAHGAAHYQGVRNFKVGEKVISLQGEPRRARWQPAAKPE